MFDIFSEQFGANGGIHGETTKRVIGRPALEPWDVFLRETVQNSWDAKASGQRSIEYRVDLTWIPPEGRDYLRQDVLVNPPPGLELKELLEDASADIALLTVSDRRTRGLGGPTRADKLTAERTDFVDFVRNVGRAHDKQIAGGTYGLGKGVLTGSSSVSTMLIFTCSHSDGKMVERFIAVANGRDFERDGCKYTGRHWWGAMGMERGGPSIEPITGSDARRVASNLGMRIPPEGQTGTSIGVIAPISFHDEEAEDIVHMIKNAATYWAWPHMIGGPGHQTIDFGFSADGENIPVAPIESDPIFREYVSAYKLALNAPEGERIEVLTGLSSSGAIWSDKPVSKLGELGVRRFQAPETVRKDILRNVALMRKPRFVVSYLDVSPDPNGFATAAVFVASDKHDEDFAKSEPVAHDDWNPQNLALEKGNANPVRIALKKIKAVFRPAPTHGVRSQLESATSGVARLSSNLGRLLDGLEGNDARIANETDSSPNSRPGGGKKTRTRRSVRLKQPHNVSLTPISDGFAAHFRFELDAAMRKHLTLRATPKIVTDSGLEDVDDELSSMVSVEGWRIPSLGVLTGDEISGTFEGEYEISVEVLQPRDVAITLEISFEEDA